MTYYEKLTKLIGGEPLKIGLETHLKYFPKLKTIEGAAEDLFLLEIESYPKQKAKAKKLGLI
jgi:hypothetical protein